MHIGLTYDLRDEYLAAGYGEEETAEFDRADTIDALDQALRSLGHETDRIGHARDLVDRLARGDRWELVFNICEGLHGTGREGQVPSLLDVYEIPYTFADPAVMAVCLHKGLTKTVVREAGVPTPRFVVVSQPLAGLLTETPPAGTDLAPHRSHIAVDLATMQFPLFAKPVAEGTGKGVDPSSRVSCVEDLEAVCGELRDRFRQPVLVEEYLPGREFTVGILGTGPDARCLGTLEIILREQAEQDVYSFVNKERCEDLVEYRWVDAGADASVRDAERIALDAWRALGCRDGGRIDLRCDAAGNPQFLEANPLAGLHPSHSDLPMLATAVGMSYRELIAGIVESAASRCAARISARAGQAR